MNAAALGPADIRRLEAAEGWLMLGNPQESLSELDCIAPAFSDHSQVLCMRWQVSAALRQWDHALEIAARLLGQNPQDPTGWIHRSYALRRSRSGGLQQAWDALLPAVSKFPRVSIIPYNIACYAAQLGRLSEAWDWLHRAIEAGEDVAALKEMALQDEDLRPIWERVRSI